MVETEPSGDLRKMERGLTADGDPLPSRYVFDPRRTDERCASCSVPYEFHDEDVLLEPACAVFV